MPTRTRSLVAVAAAVVAVGSLALANPIPGKWKIADGGFVVRKSPGNVTFAIITNTGADPVVVTSKGVSITKTGTLNPGESIALKLPNKAKNVKIVDALSGNGKGSKGVVLWANQGPGSGGGTPPGGGDKKDTGLSGI